MKKIRYPKPVKDSFNHIVDIIMLEQPAAAEFLVEEMEALIMRIRRFPKLGKKVSKYSQPTAEYREIILPPCRVIYKVESDQITIVGIIRTEEVYRLAMIVADRARNDKNWYKVG